MTSFQVADDKELPPGLCRDCSESALAAITFRQACMESHNQWSHAADFLTNIQDPTENDKVYYIFYGAQEKTIIGDQTESAASTEKALCRLNSHFQDPIEVKPKKVERARGRPYNCADCGKKFNVISFLNNHLRNTLKRACNFCGEVVPKVKLAGHLSSEHGKCVFSCGSCHQVFDDTQLLNAHLLNCHGDLKLQCKVCGVCFNSERALSAHAYSHSLFHCSSCEKCYENRKCYIYHQKVCNARRTKVNKAVNRFNRYECDHCGSTYTKKPSLRIHIIQKHLNVLPYVCETCGKRTSTISHLRSHELVHKLQRRLFVCHCGAKMRTELGFHLHQRIHSGEKPYECEECGDRFLSASRRSDHIKRRHRSTKDMPHGCEECSARFVRPFELKKHYLSVHSLKFDRPNYRQAQNYWMVEEQYVPVGICATCAAAALAVQEFRMLTQSSLKLWSKAVEALNEIPQSSAPSVKSLCAFIKSDSLAVHTVKDYTGGDTKTMLNRLKNRLTKKKHNPDKKPRSHRSGPACTCPDCGKSFYSPYYLCLHFSNSGQKEACATCGAVVIRGREMKEHLSKVHGESVISCKQCPLLFTNKLRLEKHVKKAHKLGSLTCADCGRTFPRQSSFDTHSQMHAVRTCRTCGKQFANRSCYREHRSKCEPDARPDTQSLPRNKRSNIRDPATYTCDYCGKTYTSRPQLKNHIIWIHMDVRPHQCQWCGKRFYTPARLAEHTVVHTRVRNFECDICGAKLVSRMAAVYHKRRHTGEKPYNCEECGENFISASRRSEHAKRRHGKGQFVKCMHCSATFVRGYDLKKHIEKSHRIKIDSGIQKITIEVPSMDVKDMPDLENPLRKSYKMRYSPDTLS